MIDVTGDKLITTKEVLEMAGVSRQQLTRDVKSGKITCIRVSAICRRFLESEAIEYAKEKKERGRAKEWKEKGYYGRHRADKSEEAM